VHSPVIENLSADELRKSIKLANQDLNTLLKDDDADVRIAGVKALPILAVHGIVK
jgi:hypothetical protein